VEFVVLPSRIGKLRAVPTGKARKRRTVFLEVATSSKIISIVPSDKERAASVDVRKYLVLRRRDYIPALPGA
jgi:hypothetical protein